MQKQNEMVRWEQKRITLVNKWIIIIDASEEIKIAASQSSSGFSLRFRNEQIGVHHLITHGFAKSKLENNEIETKTVICGRIS